MDGESVMQDFKQFMTELINNFLEDFQSRYDQISDDEISFILAEGGERANNQANTVLDRAKTAMGLIK